MSSILPITKMETFLRPYRTLTFLLTTFPGLNPRAIMRCAFSTLYERVLAQCKSILSHHTNRTEGSQDLRFQPWVNGNNVLRPVGTWEGAF